VKPESEHSLLLAEETTANPSDRIRVTLLCLRVSVFVVMFMWTIDKWVRPEHAASIFDHFYGLAGLGPWVMGLIGGAELLIILAFLIGFAPNISYAVVLLLHAVSTLASYRQYLHPFDGNNLLFFAAWPMLAACLTLYWLRDLDTIGRISRKHVGA
jgi:hypothetical protein